MAKSKPASKAALKVKARRCPKTEKPSQPSERVERRERDHEEWLKWALSKPGIIHHKGTKKGWPTEEELKEYDKLFEDEKPLTIEEMLEIIHR